MRPIYINFLQNLMKLKSYVCGESVLMTKQKSPFTTTGVTTSICLAILFYN